MFLHSHLSFHLLYGREAEIWPRSSDQWKDLAPSRFPQEICLTDSSVKLQSPWEQDHRFLHSRSPVASAINDLHSQLGMLISDRLSNLPEITQQSNAGLYLTLHIRTLNASTQWIIQEHLLDE